MTLPIAILKELGFDSQQDFNSRLVSVDVSTPEKMAAFRKWQNDDGTKEGLLKLPTVTLTRALMALQGMCEVWRSTCSTHGWDPEHMSQYRTAISLLKDFQT